MTSSIAKPIKLYIDYISQPARAVLAFCKFNNIPHEVEEVRVFKYQQKSEEYANINPLQKIPALEDGDFKLSESHAMMRYLANTRDVPDHWYPKKDLKKRALIDLYLDWHHSNTRRCTWFIVTNNFPGSDFVQRNNMTLEGEGKAVNIVLKKMEEVFLKDNKFIYGNEMSIADISACSEITQLRMINFDFTPYPIVQKWLDRCFEYQVMKDVHSVLFKIIEKQKSSAKL